MNDKLQEDTLEDASQEGIIKKLIETDLLVAAEVFGASIDEKNRTVIDTPTCSEKDFLQKVLKIAEISGDKLLAENVKQKISHPDLICSVAGNPICFGNLFRTVLFFLGKWGADYYQIGNIRLSPMVQHRQG